MIPRSSRGALVRAMAAAAALTALLAAPVWLAAPPPALGQGRANPVVTSLTLFAGTADGLWHSRDWGGTWERAGGGAIQRAGPVRAIRPVGPRVYVGAEGGLFLSDDFGETWTREAGDGPVLAVLPSRYHQADPTVFLGAPSGLLKSVDGGRTFRPTPLQGTPVHRLEWPGPALVVATGRGVLVSADAGETFTGPGAGLPPDEVRALALSSFYAADPVLFAGVGSSGVFRSSDGGRTWRPSGLTDRTVTDLVWLGPLLYAATESGLYRSADAGESWSALGEGLTGTRPSRLLFPLAPDSGAEVFVSTDAGLYRSSDGGNQWQPSGLKGQGVLCVATFPAPERTPGRKPRR